MSNDDYVIHCLRCGHTGPADLVPARESYDIGDARVWETVYYEACENCGSDEFEDVEQDEPEESADD